MKDDPRQSLFDQPPLSPAVVTNVAVKKVREHVDPEWFEFAIDAVRWCAHMLELFTTDDVWRRLEYLHVDGVREPRALGAAMRQAQSDKIIEATGDYRRSIRPECHQNPKMIWRSL